MTIEEYKMLAFGHKHISPRGLSLVCDQYYVVPTPDDRMAHARSEVPSTDFNGLSCVDVQMSSKYRYADSLHKPDIVAADFERGKRTASAVKKVGLNTFISTYKK